MSIFYIVYWPLAFLCDLNLLPTGHYPDTRGQVTQSVSPPRKPLRPTEAVLTLSEATSHLHKATPLTHTPGGQLDTPFCMWEAGVPLPSWPACATTAPGREGDRRRPCSGQETAGVSSKLQTLHLHRPKQPRQ